MSRENKPDDATRTIFLVKPGAVISHYEITDKLGSGGMGDVYLARDRNLGRQVALKFLPDHLSADSSFRDRFTREARAAASLSHPNVVTIYEVGEVNERVFMAMEYVDGTTLRELMDKGELSLDDCLDIVMQVCDGLAAAHAFRTVHRDVKPLNILVDRTRRVRILDFGLAKTEGDQQLTQAGVTLGTVSYMSPEQGAGREIDHRSDIFSLGVVLYEMVTGKLPFHADNMPATIHSILHDHPPTLVSCKADLPHALQAIIDRALAKSPDDRFKDLGEFRKELVKVRRGPESTQTVAIATMPAKAAVKSLAVLYLKNLGSPDDEFISYGITEDLIVDLTRLGKVRVASMRSVMKYKDSDADLEEIAEKLNVGLILDGSIVKTAEAVRVSAQLVDVESGENVWAQRWEEAPGSLPRIKQALAEGISAALEVGQTIMMKAQVGSPETSNAGAYENYLKAKYSFDNKQTRSDVDIALGLYALALREDPNLLAARAGLAEIMMYNGDFASARIELESALRAADEQDRESEKSEILRLLARTFVRQSDWTEAMRYAEEAVELARSRGDLAGEAAGLGIIISILQPQAKCEEAIGHFDRVLEISRELDDQDELAEALKAMGVAFSRNGEYDQAMGLYEESMAIAEERGNLSLQASCQSNIGNIHFFKGELDSALAHYRSSLEMAEKINDKALASRQQLNMGLVQLMSGKYREGLKLLVNAAEEFRRTGDQGTYAMALVNMSQARLTLGEIDQAISDAQEALEIARKINHPLVETDALVQLGSSHFFLREIETAVDYFQQALDIAEKSNITRSLAHIHLALVNVCLYCENFKQCRHHATKALAISREIGEKTATILSNAGLAAVEACEGLYHSGIRQLQAAYKGIERTGNVQMTVQLKALLGQILLKHGKSERDSSDGKRMLDEALVTANDIGLAPEKKLIEEIIVRE